MSQVFDNFKNRLKEIGIGLGIDKPLDVDKIDSFQEITKAYVLLAHAEIEKYFELVSLKIVNDAYLKYGREQNANSPLSALLSTDVHTVKTPEDFFEEREKFLFDYDSNDRIKHYREDYICVVKQNHGIKGRNVFNLLWKIGFKKEEVGETLLLKLDDYGRKRGFIAHTGYCPNRTLLNYDEEKTLVKELLIEIEKFDKIVDDRGLLDSATEVSDVSCILYVQ